MLERVLEVEVMDTPEEARDYDAMDNRAPNEAFTQRLVELGAFGRMLDIGTGPGHIPLLVAGRIPSSFIVGVDLSQNMLDFAERHRAASPVGARVEFRLANAKGLPFADASFDTVFSNTILHHIPDPRPFIREAWRVLRPGGVFLIRDLFRPATEEELASLVALHAAEATPEQRQLLADSLRAALTPEELRALLSELGLDREGVQVTIDSDRHASIQRGAGMR